MTIRENDICIIYNKGVFVDIEFAEINKSLSENGLRLFFHERSSYINASIDFFIPYVEILLSPDILIAISTGILSNTAWKAIETLLNHIFKKFNKKPVIKKCGDKITEKSANIHLTIGNNVLVLPINIDRESFEYVVEKFCEMAASSTPKEKTYSFYSIDEDLFFKKTESDIIQDETNKHIKHNNA